MPEDFPIMADLEKPAADTQQEPNAVAMTEVGGTDPPVGPAIVPDRDHEAGDPEQGNVEEAAEKKDEERASGAVPEEVQQISEVAFDAEDPVVGQGDVVEQAAAMDGDVSEHAQEDTKDADLAVPESKLEAVDASDMDTTTDAAPSTENKEEGPVEEIKEDKEGDKMDVAQDEQTNVVGEQNPNENATEDANGYAAVDSGTDDLFGSDDEGEKTTSMSLHHCNMASHCS